MSLLSSELVDSSESIRSLQLDFSGTAKRSFPCPICSSTVFVGIDVADRHDLGIELAQCQNCALVFVNPRPEADWFEHFYEAFYWPIYIGNRFSSLDEMFLKDKCLQRAEQILDGISGALPPKVESVLDIGCGQGGLLSAVRARNSSAQLYGVEPSESGADYCRTVHGIEVTKASWNPATADELPGNFSLVTCIHVLEHVLDPIQTLHLAAQKLHPETGRLYVEVPNLVSSAWRGGKDYLHIAHVNYFTPKTLRRVCIAAGLEPVVATEGLAELWPWACGLVCKKSETSRTRFSQASPSELKYARSYMKSRLASPSRLKLVAQKLGLMKMYRALKSQG